MEIWRAPFCRRVGLAQRGAAKEPSKALSVSGKPRCWDFSAISFIPGSAVSAVSLPSVFAGLEQWKLVFVPLIWQLLEGRGIKDTINGRREECSKTSAGKVCVFYSSAHPSLTWELDSEPVLWVRLQVRLERLDKVKRNTWFARGFQLGLCRLVELCMVIYLGN